jgi:hypothetical protein
MSATTTSWSPTDPLDRAVARQVAARDRRVGWSTPSGEILSHYLDFGLAICDMAPRRGSVSTAAPDPETACSDCLLLMRHLYGGSWRHRHLFEFNEPMTDDRLTCRCGDVL